MFDNPHYITKGISQSIPPWLVNLMWFMIYQMEVESKDYLQVFKLKKQPDGKQYVCHEQEQPPYKYEICLECKTAVTAKVFVIDDQTHSTMLLAEEY